jgi:hypothetical protein
MLRRDYQEPLNFHSHQPEKQSMSTNEFPKSHAPSFALTRLFRKKSEKTGATYFTGRLGGARVVLLKSKETSEDGGEIWNLLVSEAPKRDSEQPQRQQQPERGGPDFDSQIPF